MRRKTWEGKVEVIAIAGRTGEVTWLGLGEKETGQAFHHRHAKRLDGIRRSENENSRIWHLEC